MQFSPQQDKALKAVSDWFRHGDKKAQPYFYLAGFAGTGKTTLAKHFITGIDGSVLFAAYTGKAALRMHQTGCANASTIHSLTYRMREQNIEELNRIQKRLKTASGSERAELLALRAQLMQLHFELDTDSPVKKAALVIIDECSMVNDEMGEDLLSFGAPILVLGDPGQLPPVQGEGFFTRRDPDAFLTEIHRQAEGNPIIALSKYIRETGEAPFFFDKNAGRIQTKDQAEGFFADYNQILVGTNRTRRGINKRMRQHYNYTGLFPQKGETLICLKNDKNSGLLNGMFAEALSDGPTLSAADYGSSPYTIALDVHTELGRQLENLQVSSIPFLQYVDEKIADQIPWQYLQGSAQFDFGYGITVHKSQGSEWEKVLVIDDGMFNWGHTANPEARKRWLYTAVTRAKEQVHILRLNRRK